MKGKTKEKKRITTAVTSMPVCGVMPGAFSSSLMRNLSQGIDDGCWLASGMLGIWCECGQPRLPSVVVQPKPQRIGSKGVVWSVATSAALAGGQSALKDSESLPDTNATDLDERV